MSLTADQITIAVTVFDRRQYLKQSIGSALNQTIPVRVMVVEDCGPDVGLQAFVEQEFGGKVLYIRNPNRRGLFGNWNACMDYCQTPWLSILHDDDYLASSFVRRMLELRAHVPDCGLYFGETTVVDESGSVLPGWQRLPMREPWRRVQLTDTVEITPFPFPGHIFRVDQARQVGGFRDRSLYCGDWEMWCRLIDRFGGAQTRGIVAYNRQHAGWGRGTNQVLRAGRVYPLTFVQRKRILGMIAAHGKRLPLDRRRFQELSPLPIRYLLQYGAGLTQRILLYHLKLLWLSKPPHARYYVFQQMSRVLGPGFVRLISRLVKTAVGICKSVPHQRSLPSPRRQSGSPVATGGEK